MTPEDYTEEMKREIEVRINKASKMLEELQLKPLASVQSINTGDDIFAHKVIVYLQDTRYKKSPLQAKDLKKK